MDDVLAFSILLSLFSVTLGCIVVRVLLAVSYNVLSVIWCITAFAGVVLSFALNRIGLELPASIFIVSLTPLAAFYGHGSRSEPSSSAYWAWVYGSLLLFAAVVLTFNVRSFAQALSSVWGVEKFFTYFISVGGLLVVNALWIMMRAKK